MPPEGYETIREIGRGALGSVVLARDRQGRLVALKRLDALGPLDPSDAAGLLARARRAGALDHPNLMPVIDGFVEAGIPYVVMDVVRGGSLRKRIGELSLTEIAHVLEELLAGVGYAHAAGIVHGDLKPENVLITDGAHVKVADFGIVQAAARGGLTETGLRVGTPQYMAPELVLARDVGPASDLYSIGCMAYEMLAGRTPFSGDTPGQLLRHLTAPRPDVREADPRIPGAVARWVTEMMAIEPAERLSDAGAAWRGFEGALIEHFGPNWRDQAALRVGSPEPVGVSGSPLEVPAGSIVPVETRLRAMLATAVGAGVDVEHVAGLAPVSPSSPPYAEPLPEVAMPAPAQPPTKRSGSLPPSRARRAPAPSAPEPRRRSLLFDIARLAVLAAAAAAGARWLGLFTADVERPASSDTVDCTVFAPSGAAAGEEILIQLFAHVPALAAEARSQAEEFDSSAKRRAVRGLETAVQRGTKLTFQLDMPGAEVRDPVQALLWEGRTAAVQFSAVVAPATVPALVASVAVTQGSVPIGHIKFKLDVLDRPAPGGGDRGPVGDEASRYRRAFLSYASEDRAHAIRGAQAFRAADIECFQDVLELSPGERWEQRLYVEIERSDLFVLYWSPAAKASEWVRKEARHALGCQNREHDRPQIRPFILEVPPSPPWPELAHLHFNDAFAYVVGRSAGP